MKKKLKIGDKALLLTAYGKTRVNWKGPKLRYEPCTVKTLVGKGRVIVQLDNYSWLLTTNISDLVTGDRDMYILEPRKKVFHVLRAKDVLKTLPQL